MNHIYKFQQHSINENRPFEQATSRRKQKQKVMLKQFSKQFKQDREPIKKFTDFTK